MPKQPGEQLPGNQLSKVETRPEAQRMPGIETLRRVSDFFLDLHHKMDAAGSAWNTTVSGVVGRLLGRMMKPASAPVEPIEDITTLYKKELEYRRQHYRTYIQVVREADDRAWDKIEPYDFNSSEVVRAVKAAGDGAKAGYQQVMTVVERINGGIDVVALKVGTKMAENRGRFNDARTHVRVENTAVAEIGDPDWMWKAYAERLNQLTPEKRNEEYAALTPEAKVRVDAAYHRQYTEGVRQLQGAQTGEGNG